MTRGHHTGCGAAGQDHAARGSLCQLQGQKAPITAANPGAPGPPDGCVAYVDPEVTKVAIAADQGKQATAVAELGAERDIPCVQGVTLTGSMRPANPS